MPVKKIWKLALPSSLASDLAREVCVTPLQAQLLINRGIFGRGSARSFLDPRLVNMADPMLMKGMDEALALSSRPSTTRKRSQYMETTMPMA